MHPLDPLSADEIRAAAGLLRRERGVTDRWRFASIELREPPKQAVGTVPREAVVICWNRDDGRVYKARVDLGAERVTAWEHVPEGQPNMTVDEFNECDAALRRDPRVIEALARRGITDMDRVLIDTWAYGAHLVPERHRGGRIGWADVWYRKQPGASPYANPVSGLHFVVDLNRMELLEVEDTHRVEAPATMGEYVPHLVPGLRTREDVKPLEIAQPDGPGFTLDGHALAWQKWSLRVGFNHREGMVLHTVAYDGRSVAHRLSFAEMVVPYRDPTTDHYRRTAFDVGEWGLGFMTTSLELGCDCLGEIRYVDAVLTDSLPSTVRRERKIVPSGLSGPFGSRASSTSTRRLRGPSTSRSSRATRKCWWNGAYVRSSTRVPYGGCSPSGKLVVTMIPVARTSHSTLPSW
jgi:primary-amine oxidase